MGDRTDDLLRRWGPPTSTAPVLPGDHPDLPPGLADVWRRFGRAGFGDGRLWLTEPDGWQPAADAWAADLGPAVPTDSWCTVSRDGFGTLRLWGRRTGTSLTIHPAQGWVFPTAAPVDVVDLLCSHDPDDIDVFDVDDKPLFLRARDRLGPLAPDDLYAFVPTLADGGEPRLEALEVRDATTHVAHLATVTLRRVFPDATTS